MSTRSDIIVKRKDGKWARVYCHWDGYPSHNGKILFEHYNNQKLAEKLVKEGDISSLGEKCNKPKGHSFDNKIKGYTVYYGRDRGEDGIDARVADSLQAVWPESDTWTEYTYVWDGNQWLIGDPDEGSQTLVPLEDVLLKKKIITSLVKTPYGTLGRHTK